MDNNDKIVDFKVTKSFCFYEKSKSAVTLQHE